MKKIIFIGCLFFIGIYCYGQSIEIMTIEYNGRWDNIGGVAGRWPTQQVAPQVRSQWQSVFSRFNLVEINSGNDPFSRSNERDLEEQLENTAMESLRSKNHSQFGVDGYTVYLTMRTRRFVCFVQVILREDYYIWTYEVKQ